MSSHHSYHVENADHVRSTSSVNTRLVRRLLPSRATSFVVYIPQKICGTSLICFPIIIMQVGNTYTQNRNVHLMGVLQ